MPDFTKDHLELLAEKFPNESAVRCELINLKSILNLPKGTEHFISDLHGEVGAVNHILNNCSGVILEKVRQLFGGELGDENCRQLCTVIYYPEQELKYLRAQRRLNDEFLRSTLRQLRLLAQQMSSRYTRNYVRKQMPEGYEFVMDELMHMQHDEDENQVRYHDAIIDSIISTGAGAEVISSMATLIKRLAVERLHVVGDIFDRGPDPFGIIEMLMLQPNLDIQWGNHDILWLGAASGSAACVFTVLRISLDYGNMAVLERGYGIPLLPLSDFCAKVYGDAEAETLCHALNVLGAKLEGAVISRHPGFGMAGRLLFNAVDFERGTLELPTGTYALNNTRFPTVDRADPYRLSPEEEELVEEYVSAFTESAALRRHMDFIYRNGGTYLCYNGNLLYHGCIPFTEDGQFARVRHGGRWYSGKALLDHADATVKLAWVRREESALDMMWYLWNGLNSPFSGREFHTFERAFVDDKSTWEEPKNPYFDFWEDQAAVGRILDEFGLDPENGHIINGHTPVKARKGESPVKAGGKLFIIDGGFCKAYQKTTGIAGYTLIYGSHGIRLKAHRPFEGVAAVLEENADMESDSVSVETFPEREYIRDTHKGRRLARKIEALEALLEAYKSGEIRIKDE